MHQNTTLYRGRPHSRRHYVRWGPSSPQKTGHSPQYLAHVYCGQTAGWIKMPVSSTFPQKGGTVPIFGPCLLWPNDRMDQDATEYGGRPQPRRHCVTWGPSSSPSKKGHTPKFSAHVYCGQMLRCIRIPFHTEVGLTLGDTVLDGDPAAPYKGAYSPLLGPCLLWPNCWMDQDATWYEGRAWTGPHCVRWGLSSPPSPPKKWGTSFNFWSMSIVAKLSPISATAEHLFSILSELTLGKSLSKTLHWSQ